MRDRLTGRAGFTLLEIMLAMLVLALVVSMVSLSLSGSIRAIDATREQDEIYYRAQVAMGRIVEDLQSAVLFDEVEFTAVAAEESGQQAVLSFASMAHIVFDANNGQAGMGIIGYAVQPDREDEQQLVLLRSDVLYRPTAKQDRDTGEVEAFILCDRLRSVNFSFIDQDGKTADSWSNAAGTNGEKQGRRLPRAVTCTLEFWVDREAEQSLIFTTTVALPVAGIQPEEQEDGAA